MRDSVNPEGLTFEEWVCAAGVAVPDYCGASWEGHPYLPPVAPYTTSNTSYRLRPQAAWEKGTVLLISGTSKADYVAHKSSRTNYPKKVRQAWKDGVDPTEWRS